MSGGIDRVLRTLQSRGVTRGVLGASRGWLWVAFASWGIRRLRRASQPRLVYRGKLEPGETLQIDHLFVDQGNEPPKRKLLRKRRG